MIWRSFIPIPQITLNFWNTNIMHTQQMALFSAILLVVSICLFLPKPAVLVGYCFGMAGLFAFKYFVHFGALRHDGEAFVLFMGCSVAGYVLSQ